MSSKGGWFIPEGSATEDSTPNQSTNTDAGSDNVPNALDPMPTGQISRSVSVDNSIATPQYDSSQRYVDASGNTLVPQIGSDGTVVFILDGVDAHGNVVPNKSIVSVEQAIAEKRVSLASEFQPERRPSFNDTLAGVNALSDEGRLALEAGADEFVRVLDSAAHQNPEALNGYGAEEWAETLADEVGAMETMEDLNLAQSALENAVGKNQAQRFMTSWAQTGLATANAMAANYQLTPNRVLDLAARDSVGFVKASVSNARGDMTAMGRWLGKHAGS